MYDYRRNCRPETHQSHTFYLANSGEKTHHLNKSTRQGNVATLRRFLMMSVKYWKNRIYMSFGEKITCFIL